MTKATSFRVSKPEAKYLAELSDRLGVSQSEVLRRGLQLMAEQHLGSGASSYELGTELFGGDASIADPDLAGTLSARLRKQVRERRDGQG